MGILARPHSSDPYSRSGFLRCWWPLRDRGSARRPAGLRPRVAFQEPQKHRTHDRLVLPKNVALLVGARPREVAERVDGQISAEARSALSSA